MSIKPLAMRDVLLERIWRGMAKDPRVFLVSADFGSPVVDKIRADHPDRFINVGIAEQNLINVCAGLALEGFTVFAYAIAPFITMRCYEQVRVNLALLGSVRPMNVNLIGVGAGFSYVVSGPTHQCFEDLTVMRALPNIRVYSPADHVSAAALFDSCAGHAGPKYLRLDAQLLPVLYGDGAPSSRRGFHVHRTGERICLLATGYMTHTALRVAERLSEAGHAPAVVDLFDISGFAEDELVAVLAPYRGIVTLEEGFSGRGGLDAMMLDFVARRGLPQRVMNIGVDCSYRFELGTRAELHEQVGIDPGSVHRRVTEFLRVVAD